MSWLGYVNFSIVVLIGLLCAGGAWAQDHASPAGTFQEHILTLPEGESALTDTQRLLEDVPTGRGLL